MNLPRIHDYYYLPHIRNIRNLEVALSEYKHIYHSSLGPYKCFQNTKASPHAISRRSRLQLINLPRIHDYYCLLHIRNICELEVALSEGKLLNHIVVFWVHTNTFKTLKASLQAISRDIN